MEDVTWPNGPGRGTVGRVSWNLILPEFQATWGRNWVFRAHARAGVQFWCGAWLESGLLSRSGVQSGIGTQWGVGAAVTIPGL